MNLAPQMIKKDHDGRGNRRTGEESEEKRTEKRKEDRVTIISEYSLFEKVVQQRTKHSRAKLQYYIFIKITKG